MMTRVLFHTSLITLFALASACRSRTEDKAAQFKHIPGQLTRPNIIKLTPNTCYYDRIGSSKGRKDINQYLQKVFTKIASANPDVFTGDYAPENFCISNSPDDFVNAFASPHGRIMFTDKIVKTAPSDAAVAAVMAHEAAHILMQHTALKMKAGGVPYVDHPWLDVQGEWKSFQTSNPDKSLEIKAQIESAKGTLATATQKRADFLAPIRKFLKPATSDLEKKLRTVLSLLDQKASNLNTEIEKISQELDKYKKSEDYQKMTDEQKIALDEYYGVRIKTVLDYSPVFVSAVAMAQKELDKIDETINNELSRALTANLGGLLGSQWKKINSDYESAKAKVKGLEGQLDFNAKIFMDKASQMLGYDYNRYNWTEAEADQVGLELMLRAGINPEGTSELFLMLLQEVANNAATDEQKKKEPLEKCLKTLADLKSGQPAEIPSRGNRSHPESCWRLINTNYTELKIHESHYAPYLKNANQIDLIPGALAAIKATP